jgi:uncharacterized protein (TIGR02284 family)
MPVCRHRDCTSEEHREKEVRMATAQDDVISTLNNLIETCKDGQEGFRNAAENVKDSELKAVFNRYAQERGQFATELQAQVRRLGGDPEKSGSMAGSLHRGWMNVKAAVTGGSEAAILNAAESGEDTAKRAYEEALRVGSLPADVRSIVETQARRVKDAHDRVRDLRDSRRSA